MRLTVKITDPGPERIKELQDKVSAPEPLYNAILEGLQGDLERRWDQAVDEKGAPWKPLSDDYREWKKTVRPNAGILVFDQHMNQLHHRITKAGMRIYTGMNSEKYAARQAAHRSFLGVSEDNLEMACDLTVDFFKLSNP